MEKDYYPSFNNLNQKSIIITAQPLLLFGLIGLAIGILGLLVGVYIIILWQQQTLNPTRPLMTLLILLIVSGLLLGGFGFIGTQIVALRKEIIKVQRENRLLKRTVEKAEEHGEN